MAEEEKVETKTPEQVLVEMRETMVPKEEAQKWQDKYNELFRNVAEGTFKQEEPEMTKEEKEQQFKQALKDLSDTSKSWSDREVISRLLVIDDCNRERTGKSIFQDQKARDDGTSDEVRQFLETAVAQESDAQVTAWTSDHLNFNRF